MKITKKEVEEKYDNSIKFVLENQLLSSRLSSFIQKFEQATKEISVDDRVANHTAHLLIVCDFFMDLEKEGLITICLKSQNKV